MSPLFQIARDEPRAHFLSSYEWTKDRDDFGGYSGITLSAEGAQFTLLSDRAHLIEGMIFRHGDRILGVRSQEIAPLDFPDSLFDEKPSRDTEGLARDDDGRLYVSLESGEGVLRRDLDGSWSRLPTTPQIDELPINRGLEALAIARGGAICAIPETSDGLTQPFPVFWYTAGSGWQTPYHIERTPGFVPVGADFDDEGRLYVLERGFAGFGFFTQVRRFDLKPDSVLRGELLLRTRPRRHDNLEGLAVWRTASGERRLTMVSDDNFNRFQKTEIVEYGIE